MSLRAWTGVFLLALVAKAQVIVPNCTAFNPTNESCVLANIAYTQPSNETLVIEYAGSIEF